MTETDLMEKLTAPIKSMEELAQRLEMIPEDDTTEIGFDMSNWIPSKSTFHPCGTACCIGGWLSLCNDSTISAGSPREMFEQIWPEATFGGTEELCFPRFTTAYLATGAQAAQAVRNCVKYGEPRWRAVMRGED